MESIFLEEAPELIEEAVIGDSLENVILDTAMFDGIQVYGAIPTSKWGNPDARGYFKEYVVFVSFMGKARAWHKWAVVPFMNVQKKLMAGGWDKKYHWENIQTYCNRNIAGTRIKSNHAWPVAVDINPGQNPMRYDNKLVTDLPSEVVNIFKSEGFRWGGNYKSVKDAMHFEYLGEPVKNYVGRRVLKLKEPKMIGDDVKESQDLMHYYGYNITTDGIFGTHTDACTRSYQASKMLDSDGVIGSITWASLLAKQPDRVLKQEMDGNDVLWVQKVLNKINNAELEPDGKFGSLTLVAVKTFQKDTELEMDGIVGKNTWKMLRYKSN